jgi:hypothetical protein
MIQINAKDIWRLVGKIRWLAHTIQMKTWSRSNEGAPSAKCELRRRRLSTD